MTKVSTLSKTKASFLIGCVVFLSSCSQVADTVEPKISYTVHEKMIRSLPSAFTPLSIQELEKNWATEYRMGVHFAKKLDLYRAVTAFNRAEFLLTEEPNTLLAMQRKQEVEYYTLLCYSLGKRYEELTSFFESSSLAYINSDFSAYHDLLILLSEAYEVTKQKHKALSVQQVLAQTFPNAAEPFLIGKALQVADMKTAVAILERQAPEPIPENATIQKVLFDNVKPYHFINYDFVDKNRSQQNRAAIIDLEKTFSTYKKSPLTAQALSAAIPGAGYLYVGQYQSAFTAFSINALFIGTAAYFFTQRNLPAAILTVSFETGWYFGSIYGAGEAAKTYNERLYEAHTSPFMEEKKLHPLLQIEYGF